MKDKKRNFMPIACAVIILAAVVGLARHFHIKNFQVIAPGVLYSSGQPKGMDYTRLLYKWHIGTFVSVRNASEHREQNWYNEEVSWMRRSGVNYYEWPLAKQAERGRYPDEQYQMKFLKLMADASKQPVLIHSNSGRKRVSILTGLWLVKAKGYTIEQAVEVMERVRGEKISSEDMAFLQSL